MIRMGRGNRPETTSDYPEQQAEPAYRYAAGEPQPAVSRGAISESDSMARDIKEGRLSGFVGHGTTLTGETEFHAMLRVDGHLIGTVTSQSGTLIVGTNGQVDANVSVAAAMINGSVNGDIVASEKLQLGRTARVLGNIQSPRLIVEEGAVLEGGCSMLRARESEEEQAMSAEEEEETVPTYGAAAAADEPDDNTGYSLPIDDDDDDEPGEAEAATV